MTQQAGDDIVDGMERPRLTRARVIFGVATLLGLFSTFQAYQAAQFLYPTRKSSIWLSLGMNVGYWYVWAMAKILTHAVSGANRFLRVHPWRC